MKNNHYSCASTILSLAVLFLLLCSSCSLKYDEASNAEETNPEFVFTHAKMIRYKNNAESVKLYAESIEQYKDSNKTYGKNVNFTTYDREQKVETEGSCGYVYADSDTEIYELYDGIKLYNKVQNTNFFTNMLKWNGKTEQLTGGKRDTAKIEKDGTVIYGTGFSASGVTKSFVFSGTVSGEIETKDDKKSDQEEPEQENAQE